MKTDNFHWIFWIYKDRNRKDWWWNQNYNSIINKEVQKKNTATYGHPLPDIWPRIVKQLGMLQVAEQSLSPQSWTCLKIRHARAWVRNKGMEETRLSVSGMLSVFPETYGTMQSNPPKSKWNPPRGPSWHSAPTVSVQAPRFYVTVPCMDLRIFQNTSPSPRPPVRL